MDLRPLGTTDLQVSAIGLGAMMFGSYGNSSHRDCIRMVHRAIDAGVNLIDTADIYSHGESEAIIGRALAGRREEVVLATKFGLPMSDRTDERGASRRWILRAVEGSLRRLGTDYIDLYQLHRPDTSTALTETLAALNDLVRAGKVRYVGCSTMPAWMLMEAAWVAKEHGVIGFSTEQAPYSVLFRDAEQDVFEVCRRLNLGVLAWSPLASGLLTGRYRASEGYAEGSRAARADVLGPDVARRFDRHVPAVEPKLDLVGQFVDICRGAGVPPAHAAISFAGRHPSVTSTLVGPRTHEQLEDALAGSELALSDELLDSIDRLVPPGTHVTSEDRRWVGGWTDKPQRRRPLR